MGKTLGIGAFGKVKCKCFSRLVSWPLHHFVYVYFILTLEIISGASHYNGAKGCCQNIKQKQNKTTGNGRESAQRNQYSENVYSSSYN